MVYMLWPSKDFKLAYKVKFDLGSQRLLFAKVAQFNEKHCCKGLMKISRMVYELEAFKDFFDHGGQL